MTAASVILDISRTVARARLPAATGIDRVERAYIDWALQRGSSFLAANRSQQHLLDAPAVQELISWLDGDGAAPDMDLRASLSVTRDARLRRAWSHVRRNARAVFDVGSFDGLARAGDIYLNVGHDNLLAPLMDGFGRAGVRRAVLIHDVIPADHPQYARSGAPEKFRKKLAAAAAADAIIANSDDTADRLGKHMTLPAIVRTAPLGISPPPQIDVMAPEQPYFLCLGTIEPRKNHALLLDVWSDLGPGAPTLHIVGRRGWENRETFRRLDTDAAMGQSVLERGAIGDCELERLLSGAVALLFPSLAEGYGLPLAEALARGVPVLASDLPALREVGGDVPDWLTPGDRAGWTEAVLDYATRGSTRRAAQMRRMAGWEMPTWAAHFDLVENVLETILVQSSPER